KLTQEDDLVVQRVPIRPEVFRQRLIDDDHRWAALVPLGKCAATQDRYLEGLEVACGNQRPYRAAPRIRPFGTSCDLEEFAQAVLQRHARGGSRELDARKQTDAANSLVNHFSHAPWLFELRTRKLHAHR